MTFFKHPYNASFLKAVIKLEQDFNLAGIGFLWKLSEKLCLNQGACPLHDVLNWSYRGLKKTEILQILSAEYDFFLIDENKIVRPSATWAKLLGLLRTGSPAEAGAEAGTEAGAPDPAHAGHCPTNREDKNRKENSLKEALSQGAEQRECEIFPREVSAEEREFNQKMLQSYPRICQMKQPLTFLQMERLLAEGIPATKIASVLKDMENCSKLLTRYISANLTLRSWLRVGRY